MARVSQEEASSSEPVLVGESLYQQMGSLDTDWWLVPHLRTGEKGSTELGFTLLA